MKIYVVRHGETDWNGKKLQGRTDIDLNSNGIKQANDLKNNIGDKIKDIDLIISSPLIRAKHTAEILSDGRVPIIYNEKIIERAFGELEGMELGNDKNIVTFINELYDLNIKKNYKGLEDFSTLFERISSFFEDIKNEYKDKTIMLVTHGGAMRAIHAYFNGIPENRTCLSSRI